MKMLIIFLVASVTAYQENTRMTAVEFRNKWMETVTPFMSECMCQTGSGPAIVNNFFQTGEMSQNPCFKCNLKCFGEKLNIISANGAVDIKRWSELVKTDLPLSEYEKCAKSTDGDICNKVHKMVDCISKAVATPQKPSYWR